MNTVLFNITYLITMLFTYFWRYFFNILAPSTQNTLEYSYGSITYSSGGSLAELAQQKAETQAIEMLNFDKSTLYLCLIINYILLILIAYYRGKKTNKKYIAGFPLIGGFFDILLAHIPFVPTIMNIVTLIMGASSSKKNIN